MSRQKKSSIGLVMMLIVIGFIVLVGGFFGYRYYQIKKEVTKTLENYQTQLEKQDYGKVMTLFDSDSFVKSGYDKKDVQGKYEAIFSSLNVSKVEITDFKQEKTPDDTYKITYKMNFTTPYGKIENESYETKLIKKENKWQLEWAPNLIFNEMTGQDKVQIQEDKAKRGEIIDRNEQKLAENYDYDQLGLVPAKLGEGSQRETHLQEISEQFDVSLEELTALLEPSWATGDVFVPVKVLSEKVTSEALAALPQGVLIGTKEMRHYPLGEAGAQLIGYTGSVTAEELEKDDSLSAEMTVGKTGLEQAFDKRLRGTDGISVQIENESGEVKRVILSHEKKDGEQVQLSLDSKAQQVAFESLKKQPGTAVVSEPKTGELLVATSSPSFDPNKMVTGISTKEYESYSKNTDLPFIERYATGYAPGSTFKTLTGAIAMDANKLTPEEEISIEGLKWQKDSSWGDYYVTRVKEATPINLEKALVYSDNIYFAQQSLKMGEKVFREGLKKFNFNESLKLPIAVPKAKISNEESFNSEILLADTGYGQGELMIAPLTQLSMYSVLMNEGTLVYPTIEKNSDSDMKPKEKVISQEASSIILDDLKHVVSDSDGYAHEINQANREIAAKTGTAEIKDKQDTKGQENSFLLFMDAQNKGFMGLLLSEDATKNGTAVSKSSALVSYLSEHY